MKLTIDVVQPHPDSAANADTRSIQALSYLGHIFYVTTVTSCAETNAVNCA
jgi:hypothetical protein